MRWRSAGYAGVFLLVVAATARAEEPDLSRFQREFSAKERGHWAYQPVRDQPVPVVQNANWVRNPIDAFILARLEDQGITPAPEADRRAWLRRVYLDLVGLPPTPQEQQRFSEDGSDQAYEKVVDDLLSRPQYGERWARHWLDVVRYAESNGYERDGTKPNAWRYRDYVIRSFNADKPFDRFLIEQLAGDEIEGSNAETQIATTFLRLGTWDDEPAEFVLDRYEQLDDVLGTTATTFLAATLHCARCHEHKFEPFTQVDYARLLAVFEPLKRPQDIVSATHRKEHDRFVGTEAELAAYREQTAEVNRKVGQAKLEIDRLIATIRVRLFAQAQTALPVEAVAAFQTAEDQRSDAQRKLVEAHAKKLDEEIAAHSTDAERKHRESLEQRIAVIEAGRPAEPPRAYIWYEDTPEAPKTHVYVRGDPARPAVEVLPGVPAILEECGTAGDSSAALQSVVAPQPAAKSTGRRLWLARWLASRRNPLTARVMVNRLWQ